MNEEESEATLIPLSGEPLEAVAGVEAVPEYEPELLAGERARAVSPEREGLRRWTTLLLKFTSVQVFVQAIGFATSILVIRNLPKREYAFYTLCNTMLATVLVLADSGIGSALTAIGGRVWQQRKQLSQLMQTALQLRRRIASAAVPVVISILIWLLHRNGAGAGKISMLVTIVLLGCALELVTRIYAVALRVRCEVRQIQRQAMVASLVKFAVVAAAAMLFFNVEIALLAVAAGYAAQYWMLQRWSATHLDADAPSDPGMRREILSVVRRQSPHTLYYCLQSQMIVWLISIFGNAERVADVGALSRLALLFAVVGSVTGEVLFPAFARVQSAAMVRKRYLQIIFTFAALCSLLISVVAIFPGQVLSVLGNRYSNLHTEGVLMAVSSVLGTLAGMTWTLNAARAWIIPPSRYIPAAIALQIVLIHFLNLSTVRGVLALSILTAIPDFAWSFAFGLLQIRKLQALASG